MVVVVVVFKKKKMGSLLAPLLVIGFLLLGVSTCEAQDPQHLLQTTLQAILRGQISIMARLDGMTERFYKVESAINSTQEELMSSKLAITANMNDIENLTSVTQKILKEILEKKEESERRDSNATIQRNVKVTNCQDLLDEGMHQSGVYNITPKGFSDGVEVYCDQETDGGGWTVFLQRKRQMRQVDFARTFEEYASGFGDLNGEFWIGNRVLHALTSDKPFTLRVEAENLQRESKTGIWKIFSVGSEDTKFTLSVRDYANQSTLGDALFSPPPSLSSIYHNADGQKFSAIDEDNDSYPGYDCSEVSGNGGWWYNGCFGVNPTAPLSTIKTRTKARWIYWDTPTTFTNTWLYEIQFMIRPPPQN